MEFKETTPLRCPDGYGRTLIDERKSQKAWKKQMSVYITQAMHELSLLGAGMAEVTHNDSKVAERDPRRRGVVLDHAHKGHLVADRTPDRQPESDATGNRQSVQATLVVERMMERSFRTALPAPASKEADHVVAPVA